MSTFLTGVEVTNIDSKTLRAWIREVNLHDIKGNPITLRKAAEIIIADFAEVLRTDENLLAEIHHDQEHLKKVLEEEL